MSYSYEYYKMIICNPHKYKICELHMDSDALLEALENESNSSIINLTSAKIANHKNTILQDLFLPKEILKLYHKKLKHYRYCSEISD